MLDEEEYKSIQDAYSIGALEVKKARRIENRPLRKSDDAILYGGVAARYLKITGVSDVDHREILRHRLSLLGPPCEKCGKEHSYRASDVLKFEMEPPESFTPHPLFAEGGTDSPAAVQHRKSKD